MPPVASAYALDPYYVGTPAEPSDSYRESKYYDALCDVQLTGDMAYDIVSVALSQVGYREGNSDSELHGGNKYGSYDYNEYSYWWDGMSQRGWCAAFVTWCARQAGISPAVLKGTLAANPVAFDLTLSPKSTHEPRIGDLIFFDWDYDGSSDHVGLVAKVSAQKVLVVHGNYSEYVTVTLFDRAVRDILGYARPAYTSAYFAGEPVSLMPAHNTAYLYQDGKYFRQLIGVELTGNPAIDIGLIAESQLGYRAAEDNLGYNGESDSNSVGTYTEYERWLPNTQYAGDWGTCFVLWCARMAGADSSVLTGTCLPRPDYLDIDYVERSEASASGHPKVGDIAFFTWPFTSYTWDNCAIVTHADDSSVTVVIGNIEDGVVEEQTYAVNDERIRGYGVPEYGAPAPNILHFDPNGGICDTESMYAYGGNAYGWLPEATREGYVFDGWYNGDTAVTAATEYPGGNLTLTAKWRLPTYKVSFDTLGNGESPAERIIEKGSALGELPVLVRDGYTFRGWFTAAEGGDPVSDTTAVTSEMKLYARFSVTVGNINGDSRINSMDAAILARYIAGWTGYDELVHLEAADLDGDGRPATSRDAAYLARHLAGWSGYEEFPIRTE